MIPVGQIWLDSIPIDEFIQRHGRAVAHRRLGEFGRRLAMHHWHWYGQRLNLEALVKLAYQSYSLNISWPI
jgi:hypothetical protein